MNGAKLLALVKKYNYRLNHVWIQETQEN